jgi:hypothetical protein
MKTDPSDTGGLFVGRRPGTRPITYRTPPEPQDERRRQLDAWLAAGILVIMTFVVLAFWGPLPVAWLWLGSQVDYVSGSPFLGIVVAFFGLLFTLLIGLMATRRLDLAWILVRRAAGHDQRQGTIGPVFAIASVIGATAFGLWLLMFSGAELAPVGISI